MLVTGFGKEFLTSLMLVCQEMIEFSLVFKQLVDTINYCYCLDCNRHCRCCNRHCRYVRTSGCSSHESTFVVIIGTVLGLRNFLRNLQPG